MNYEMEILGVWQNTLFQYFIKYTEYGCRHDYRLVDRITADPKDEATHHFKKWISVVKGEKLFAVLYKIGTAAD